MKARWLGVVGLAFALGACGSEDGGDEGAVDGGRAKSSDAGERTGTDAGPYVPPTGDGCAAPPPPDFDPTSGFEWDAPTPDLVVTSDAASGPGSLAEALSTAEDGQVIGFDPSLAGETIAVADELVVRRSITIDATAAPGLTLDGGGATRIMTVGKGLETRIVGLTFIGGQTTDEGGAVKVEQADEGNPHGRVEVIGCRFENNTGAGAGALFIGWRIHGLVRDSVFVGNDATEGTDAQRGKSGGAIATRQNASLRIERCSFVGNQGAKAGAVYNILQPVVVEDSVFADNEATSGSGAFFTDGGNGAGPANDPETDADGEITLRRVRVTGNRGTGAGGAILLWGYPRDRTIIEGSVFLDNGTAGDKGGAGRVHAPAPLSIHNTVFARNASSQQGGGMWIDGAGDVDMVNVTFSGNSVDTDAGGGFTYNGDGRLEVRNAVFAHNRAGRAAGGFWKRPAVEGVVSNSIFAFNEVGENIGERHMGPRPDDGGGNIDWAVEEPDRGRAFEGSTFADPLLRDLTAVDGTWLHPLGDGSPAIDAANDAAPSYDARGGERDGAPDVGPFEAGAACPAG